jgi:hypothetical protein
MIDPAILSALDQKDALPDETRQALLSALSAIGQARRDVQSIPWDFGDVVTGYLSKAGSMVAAKLDGETMTGSSGYLRERGNK